MQLNASEKQDLRHAAREALAARHPNALALRAIDRAITRSLPFSFSDDDLLGALEFLAGLGQVKVENDELGAQRYWRATSEGLLAHERSKRQESPTSRE